MLQFANRCEAPGIAFPRADFRSTFRDALPDPDWVVRAHAGVVVLLAEVDGWRDWLEDAWDLLDDAERARIIRQRHAANRDQLTLSYAAHRFMVGEFLGLDPQQVPMARDPLGRPHVAGQPLHTSLSHADGCIVLALGLRGPLGVDVESTSRAVAMPDIATCVCHPADAARLAGHVGPEWNQALLRLWVRKEAVLKAAGVGLSRDMHGFDLPESGMALLDQASGAWTQVRMLDASPGRVAAIAAPPGIGIDMAWLQPPAVVD